MSSPAWLIELTVDRAQTLFATGQLTAEQLVTAYLERIAARNDGPNGLRAVTEVNPDALQIAAALDRERLIRGPRGPLHGIPVLLKDNIDTSDHLHTSAGSLALESNLARRDAYLVRRLRTAGCVILGKASMTEWANFMTDGMPNGYSSRVGQVRNPYGPFDVGGSSSGSAVAVAANLSMLAVGTETSGSILSPASRNSVVGIKPTLGWISRRGIIPIAHSQDTAGPLARSVRDAALLLHAMAGPDRGDPATWSTPALQLPPLSPDALRGCRLGVPRHIYCSDLPEHLSGGLAAALAVLRAAGAEIVDPAEIPSAAREWNENVLVYEFKPDLNAYLGALSWDVPVHSLRELIVFNERYRRQMLRYGQTLLLMAETTSGTLAEPEYIHARLHDLRWSRSEGLDHAFREDRLDAVLFLNHFGADIAARAGYPSVSVPAGRTKAGEPFSITFTGAAFSDARLLSLAYAFEQATQQRMKPEPQLS